MRSDWFKRIIFAIQHDAAGACMAGSGAYLARKWTNCLCMNMNVPIAAIVLKKCWEFPNGRTSFAKNAGARFGAYTRARAPSGRSLPRRAVKAARAVAAEIAPAAMAADIDAGRGLGAIMKEKLKILGGARLEGETAVSGGKNAAVAIIPAALLADSPSVIDNLPDIEDVHVLVEMLRWLGAKIDFRENTMWIDPRTVDKYDPPYELVSRMRASYYLAPILLGLFHQAEVPMPGGCDIGARPIDQTLKALRALGAQVDTLGGVLDAKVEELIGSDIFLDMPSVGATVNSMLAAVSASGTTCIHNAAKEPHIVDLANFLSSMGAMVKGAGTDVIRIRGGRHLHGANYTIVPDQIETGTLMIAAAATAGDVVITGAIPTHMESLSAKLLEMGVNVQCEDDWIRVRSNGVFRAVNVKTQGYPGFPTDLQQPLSTVLTVANGTSIVTETIFESRFRFLDELRRMGANVRVIENTAIIGGVDHLVGTRVNATDLRAGAAMVIAALMARGVTEIGGVGYILRGYERLDEKLAALGANIQRERIEEAHSLA